jgi:hypothetical protein
MVTKIGLDHGFLFASLALVGLEDGDSLFNLQRKQ